MKAFSQKKKIGIIATAILTLTVLGLVGTGHSNLSGLKSDILNTTCTQDFLTQKLSEYTTKKAQISANLGNISQSQGIIDGQQFLINKENKRIDNYNDEIKQIDKKINDAQKYIKEKCNGPVSFQPSECKNKKKNISNWQDDKQHRKEGIGDSQKRIKQYNNTIGINQTNIKNLETANKTLQIFVDEYEKCMKNPPGVCNGLIISPNSVINGGAITYSCVGINSTNYSVVVKAPDGTVLQTIGQPTGSFTLSGAPSGIYSVSCYVNGQTTTSTECQKTVTNTVVGPPVCTNLTISPSSVLNGGNITYSCTGNNVTNYSVVFRKPDNSILQTLTTSNGSISIPATPTGTYYASCFVDGQVSTPEVCTKTLINSAPLQTQILFDKRDANTSDIDGVVGNDSQTVLSGNAAVFKIRITNTGTEDLKNLTLTDTIAPNCGGAVTLPSYFPSTWSNFITSGAGNHADNILQPGENFEYTCEKNNTTANYTNSATVNAYGNISSIAVSMTDTTSVLMNPLATCDTLTINPSYTIGGTVSYTCSGTNATTYSVVVKNPDGTQLTKVSSATGEFMLPGTLLGNYTAECFVDNQTTTPDSCKKNIPIDHGVILSTPVLNTQLSSPSGYIISTNSNTGSSHAVFNITATGGTAVINELKFTVSGGAPQSVTSVEVDGESVAVVNGVAWLQNLSIPITAGGTKQITASFTYSFVGTGGVQSGTANAVTLSEITYGAMGHTTIMNTDVSAKGMILVGSLPHVTTPGVSFTQFGLVVGGENKIGEVTVTADPHGDIRINTISFASNYFGPANSISLPIRITSDGGASVAGSNCYFDIGGGNGNGYGSKLIKCDFGTPDKLDHDGYIVTAGMSKTFSLYAVINGNTIQTRVGEQSFNWEDSTYDGTEGNTFSGGLLPNFPYLNQYNRGI